MQLRDLLREVNKSPHACLSLPLEPYILFKLDIIFCYAYILSKEK